ncbi:MAG: hypothetical protein MHM6MM_002374 [Cercozoa sp. M6MM]
MSEPQVDFSDEDVEMGGETQRKGSNFKLPSRRVGRGHRDQMRDDRYHGAGGRFETTGETQVGDAIKSVEGWVLFVTGVHEEAQEDDVYDAFAEYGDIRRVEVPLDRRSGFVKGYALVEFSEQADAKSAIDKLHGSELYGQKLSVNWAFAPRPSRRATSSRD